MSRYSYKEINEPNYNIESFDQYIGVLYTIQGSCTITLPKISETGRRSYVITDVGGNASQNPIIIQAEEGDNIEKGSSRTIDSDYGSKTFFNDDKEGWYISSK